MKKLDEEQRLAVRELIKRIDKISNYKTAIEYTELHDSTDSRRIEILQQDIKYEENKTAEIKAELGLEE